MTGEGVGTPGPSASALTAAMARQMARGEGRHDPQRSFYNQLGRKRAITLSRKDWRFGMNRASLLRQH
jgi:hypothetical protein